VSSSHEPEAQSNNRTSTTPPIHEPPSFDELDNEP
jgi:hypothetical protein